MENILLNLTVKRDGYFGDWRTAIDEAYTLSKQFNIGCLLNYANQDTFKKDVTEEELVMCSNFVNGIWTKI